MRGGGVAARLPRHPRAVGLVDGRGAGAVLSRIIAVAETGSTNADLLALARDGAAEGTWLRAERQTAGRGRQGRGWHSPAGNLYVSGLVRWRAGDPSAPTLAFVSAVAVEEVVGALMQSMRFLGKGRGPESNRSQLGPGLRRGGEDLDGNGLLIKWPNDLLLGGAKLAGILLEREGDAVVVGCGVNLAHAPDLPDRRATSLAAHGVAVTAAEFLDHLAAAFAGWLARWRSEGLAPVIARWSARAHPPGTPLVARLPDGASVEGLYAGLAPDGALNLRLADGGVRTIHAADVFLI